MVRLGRKGDEKPGTGHDIERPTTIKPMQTQQSALEAAIIQECRDRHSAAVPKGRCVAAFVLVPKKKITRAIPEDVWSLDAAPRPEVASQAGADA